MWTEYGHYRGLKLKQNFMRISLEIVANLMNRRRRQLNRYNNKACEKVEERTDKTPLRDL